MFISTIFSRKHWINTVPYNACIIDKNGDVIKQNDLFADNFRSIYNITSLDPNIIKGVCKSLFTNSKKIQ